MSEYSGTYACQEETHTRCATHAFHPPKQHHPIPRNPTLVVLPPLQTVPQEKPFLSLTRIPLPGKQASCSLFTNRPSLLPPPRHCTPVSNSQSPAPSGALITAPAPIRGPCSSTSTRRPQRDSKAAQKSPEDQQADEKQNKTRRTKQDKTWDHNTHNGEEERIHRVYCRTACEKRNKIEVGCVPDQPDRTQKYII